MLSDEQVQQQVKSFEKAIAALSEVTESLKTIPFTYLTATVERMARDLNIHMELRKQYLSEKKESQDADINH